MITGMVIVGSAERGETVCTPEPMLKLMTSVPGLALASRIACLSEPMPVSLALLTIKVIPVAGSVGEDSWGYFVVCKARDTGEGRAVSERDSNRLRIKHSFMSVGSPFDRRKRVRPSDCSLHRNTKCQFR